LRIVVDVKKSERADVVLNNLYSQTQLQLNYGVNMVALVNGQPKRLNLKEVVEAFIRHRKEVVTRRSLHELKKARQRVHILEGLAVALANITDVIAKIKASNTSSEAKNQLLNCCWPPGFVQDIIADLDPSLYRLADLPETYGLQDETTYYMSADQVDALLALRLHRLTGLEQDKILSEFRELIERIKYLINVLKNTDKLLEVICEELEEIKQQFGDARKTSILDSTEHFDYEDLIHEENMVVTLSFDGYVKRQPLKEYRAQKRGGRGKSAIKMKSEDAIAQMVVASTHAMMLCFSNYGKVYWRKVHQFPQAGRGSKGKPFNNFLPLQHDEKITTMMAVDDFHQEAFVIMATQNGVIKKTGLKAFSKPRKAGITAITLDQGDALMNVALTNGHYQIMLFSNAGKAVRFSETDVRETGRNTRGVRGMKLHQGQWIVGLVVTRSETSYVLTVTENGYGKRTKVSEYRKTSRGSQGVIAMTTSERNGAVVGAILVDKDDEMMLISDYGTLVRTRVCEVRETARAAQGVNLINLQGSEKLVAIRSISDHAQIESNDSEKDS
jgi:DNA gyrase subunit A